MTVRFRVDQEGGQEHFVKLANSLWRSKRCVVVTGAGISVSGGIPDFRSADGLYNLVKAKYPDVVVKGKDLFDATLFKDPQSTSLFYTFMAELKGVIQQATTTPTHHFVKNLDERGQLLRCYTQNIDCLELRLQMSCDLSDKQAGRIVQLHGDLDHVVCTMCQALFKFHDEYRAVYREGDPPECPQCVEMDGVRLAAGKRPVAVGTLRPNIVLYNEHHSRGDQIADMAAYDVKRRPDMLIVMGTSLKVVGIKRLVKDLAKTVHDLKNGVVVFINNAEVGSREWDDVFDYHIMGMTDDVVQDLEMEMKKMDISAQIRAQRLAKGKEQRILASIQTQSAAAAVMTSVGVACIANSVMSAVNSKLAVTKREATETPPPLEIDGVESDDSKPMDISIPIPQITTASRAKTTLKKSLKAAPAKRENTQAMLALAKDTILNAKKTIAKKPRKTAVAGKTRKAPAKKGKTTSVIDTPPSSPGIKAFLDCAKPFTRQTMKMLVD